jgi:negative regulator of sigma E activity
MRDHVTDELLSAYVDGELEGDELQLVEDLLAESPEHQQLLAEFKALRASMWSLPSFNLPADFHTRVVSQIDELADSPSQEPVQPASRESKARPWRSVLFAAASLAAVVAATVMLQPPSPDPELPGPPDGVTTPVKQRIPDFLQQVPKYVMVYDVTVTPAGQKNEAIDTLLRNLGIGIDPALRLDGALEKELMAIRESQQVKGNTEATPYKNDLGTPKSTDQDKVEMIYVASTIGVLDQFGRNLDQMRRAGDGISQLHYDLAIEPNKVGVMHRLHDKATEHFAHHTDAVPFDLVGQAFRISFRLELTSVSVPGAATFPIPTIRPEPASSGASGSRDPDGLDVNADGAVTAADAAKVISQLNQLGGEKDLDSGIGIDQGGQPGKWAMEPGHVLLIIRNVGANADDAK